MTEFSEERKEAETLDPAEGEKKLDSLNLDSKYVGNFKLLQQIGEGGMGSVWMADQEKPVRRRVALKVIKAGMDSKQVIARFEAERQALAMMDHQNIAKVLDAGMTDDGRPYFAMELVQGIPITQYCDKNKLTPDERLELFVPICHAIQHAHQKGIIHRDLKPSNVLVTLYDGKPVPKVIDFGLAKALQHQFKLTDKTMFTEFGQVVGTLQYMSPEQAEMNALDVDTRTDIYSLGVMLYELLTGSTPLDKQTLSQNAMYQLLQVIKEKDPPRPSTRISESGDAITGISEQRKIAPTKLQQILRGELDWIVMKALEKDRTRRYETASGFADDIQRYLHNDTVRARPPSTSYRVRKFVTKNRGLVATVATIAVLLVAGIAGTGWFAVKASQSAEKARNAEEIAKAKEAEAKREAERADKERDAALAAQQLANWRLYSNKIKLAQTEWSYGDPELAFSTLNSCDWQFRGWEHDYLYTLFTSNRRTLTGHTGDVTKVAFSPDGKQVISGSWDNAIRVWNVETGKQTDTVKGRPAVVTSVAFSANGKQIVIAGSNNSLRIWSAKSGERTLMLQGHTAFVTSVALSPNEKQIVSGNSDNTLRIWNGETGEQIRTLKGNQGYVNSVGFSPDGTRVVSGSSDNMVRVWDAETGDQIHSLSGHLQTVNSVAFSPSGKQIVSGSSDNTLRVWLAETGQETITLSGHTQSVTEVAFSPDGKRIVSGSGDNTVKVWNAATGEQTITLKGHTLPVICVAFSPDGKRVVSGSFDNTIRIWNIEPSEESLALGGHAHSVSSVAFSPDGTQIVSGGFDNKVRIWNSKTGEQTLTLSGHTAAVNAVAFSPSSEQVISGGSDNTIRVWSAHTGQPSLTISGHQASLLPDKPAAITSVAFSPNAAQIVSAGRDGWIRIWNAKTGAQQRAVRPRSQTDIVALAVAFSKDGKQIASRGLLGAIRIWNVQSGVQTSSLKERKQGQKNIGRYKQDIAGVAFSPDGKRIVSSGDSDNTIQVWAIDFGVQTLTLKGHTGHVTSVGFSPDGKRIISGSADKTIKVWSAESGEETLTLKGPTDGVTSLAFSPDGKLIVGGSLDNTIRLWNGQFAQGTGY